MKHKNLLTIAALASALLLPNFGWGATTGELTIDGGTTGTDTAIDLEASGTTTIKTYSSGDTSEYGNTITVDDATAGTNTLELTVTDGQKLSGDITIGNDVALGETKIDLQNGSITPSNVAIDTADANDIIVSLNGEVGGTWDLGTTSGNLNVTVKENFSEADGFALAPDGVGGSSSLTIADDAETKTYNKTSNWTSQMVDNFNSITIEQGTTGALTIDDSSKVNGETLKLQDGGSADITTISDAAHAITIDADSTSGSGDVTYTLSEAKTHSGGLTLGNTTPIGSFVGTVSGESQVTGDFIVNTKSNESSEGTIAVTVDGTFGASGKTLTLDSGTAGSTGTGDIALNFTGANATTFDYETVNINAENDLTVTIGANYTEGSNLQTTFNTMTVGGSKSLLLTGNNSISNLAKIGANMAAGLTVKGGSELTIDEDSPANFDDTLKIGNGTDSVGSAKVTADTTNTSTLSNALTVQGYDSSNKSTLDLTDKTLDMQGNTLTLTHAIVKTTIDGSNTSTRGNVSATAAATLSNTVSIVPTVTNVQNLTATSVILIDAGSTDFSGVDGLELATSASKPLLDLALDTDTTGELKLAITPADAATMQSSYNMTANDASDAIALQGALSSSDADTLANFKTADLKTTVQDMNRTGSIEGLSASQGALASANQAVASRVADVRGADGLGAGSDDMLLWQVWGDAIYNYQKESQHDNISAYRNNTYTAALGLDRLFTDNLRVGLAYSYSNADINMDNSSNSNKLDGHIITAYTDFSCNNLYVNGHVNYGFNKQDIKRNMSLLSKTATAKPNGNSIGLGVEAGYTIAATQDLGVTPFLGLDYNYSKIDKYTEKNAGGANQAIHKLENNVITSALGAKFDFVKDLSGSDQSITTQFRAAWIHDWANNTIKQKRDNFSDIKIKPDTDKFTAGIGVTNKLSERASLSLDYDFTGSNNITNHQGKLNFTYKF